jgi:DNA polymerase-1
MRIAVGGAPGDGGVLRPVAEDGTPLGPPEPVADLVAAMAAREAGSAEPIRWVWAAAGHVYPRLLAGGVRVARCHDLELTETLLLRNDGRFREPRSLPAAFARLRGLAVPKDTTRSGPPTLFDDEPEDDIDAVVAVHAEQQRRIGLSGLRLLAAAESAGGLAGAEMGFDGLPWSADAHDALLTDLMGPRPPTGMRPRRLQELADAIREALGDRGVNPDSPMQLLKAFRAAGITIPSTRSHVLREVDHPAAEILLKYKELARIWVAHGWGWLDSWVRDGRFRPEYIVGGVVSGRWATSGGGALQIPKVLRRAVVADPGWTLMVADAAQLEPRVLAALAGDRAFAAAAGETDLYAALAGVFGGERQKAKIALLSAMYGGSSGEAPQLLAIMRRRFPLAYEYVEAAARAGEAGKRVSSRLGRICPPPSAEWREAAVQEGGRSAVRDRGRFTRNFVVQASAADWALVLLVVLRRRLAALAAAGPADRAPRLVFFQHDEVIVYTPCELTDAVTAAIADSAEEARRLVFGDTPVRFPLGAVPVRCYADAK